MVGARVNGKLVKVDYKIQNGDRIEILTSRIRKDQAGTGSILSRAPRRRIRSTNGLRSSLRKKIIIRGKEMLVSYCKSKGLEQGNLLSQISADRTAEIWF